MEGLIMMIIIGIISSLLSKNKEKQEQKPTKAMPPFSQQKPTRESTQRRSTTSERPKVKSLEDFANEIFGQLNEKTEQKQVTHEPIVEQAKPVVREEVVRETRKSTRPQLGASRPIVQQAKKESLVVVPQTKEQLMQAIITSEILGLPKAKQRK